MSHSFNYALDRLSSRPTIIMIAGVAAIAFVRVAGAAPSDPAVTLGADTLLVPPRVVDAQDASIEIYRAARGGCAPEFRVEYDDVSLNNNYGFDDPTQGAARRAGVVAVFAYLSSTIYDCGSADVRFLESLTAGSGLAAAGCCWFENAVQAATRCHWYENGIVTPSGGCSHPLPLSF